MPNWSYDPLRSPEARVAIKDETCVLCGKEHAPVFCFGCYDPMKEERICLTCLREAIRIVEACKG